MMTIFLLPQETNSLGQQFHNSNNKKKHATTTQQHHHSTTVKRRHNNNKSNSNRKRSCGILLTSAVFISPVSASFVVLTNRRSFSHRGIKQNVRRTITTTTTTTTTTASSSNSGTTRQSNNGDHITVDNDEKEKNDVVKSLSASSFDTSEASSKGIVSTLTNLVNFIMGDSSNNNNNNNSNNSDDNNSNDATDTLVMSQSDITDLCITPQQLMDKIKSDYVDNNYLWTGDIYLPAFEPTCTFTDPTLSFVGRDKFVSNVQNLLPIVDFFTNEDDICKSELLDIRLNEEKGYVESRWNMVGSLSVLPWKPCIDVIGRTKFWYRNANIRITSDVKEGEKSGNGNGWYNGSTTTSSNNTALRVYEYDEMWEMPASRALLQLVTKGGTITSQK